MNLSLYIAGRYLFSKKSHQVINIISGVAIAGIAAPLKMARDSIKVDTSEMDIDQVIAHIKDIVGKKIGV